jgi:hypothetical protein
VKHEGKRLEMVMKRILFVLSLFLFCVLIAGENSPQKLTGEKDLNAFLKFHSYNNTYRQFLNLISRKIGLSVSDGNGGFRILPSDFENNRLKDKIAESRLQRDIDESLENIKLDFQDKSFKYKKVVKKGDALCWPDYYEPLLDGKNDILAVFFGKETLDAEYVFIKEDGVYKLILLCII